ncbi:uncharacterized isoform X3 [Zea mays]|uniref:uncharacterized isoform X3 n=1 Tax=Zea mays TaxID=4577 RepID=UPI0004DEA2EF|nr:uncharacterized protein LOC100502149 isoform X3 [Zea mays]|eukprot:XP_008677736.1 uncharacterized LOC100502149 isoform X5 [Zea mays]
MATDALALMDHLGWKKAHVFGHSMGAMIACKLDVMAPHRLCSLALLNVTRGGFQCFPKVDAQMLSLAFRFLRAKTPEERALVDLETHYTKTTSSPWSLSVLPKIFLSNNLVKVSREVAWTLEWSKVYDSRQVCASVM